MLQLLSVFVTAIVASVIGGVIGGLLVRRWSRFGGQSIDWSELPHIEQLTRALNDLKSGINECLRQVASSNADTTRMPSSVARNAPEQRLPDARLLTDARANAERARLAVPQKGQSAPLAWAASPEKVSETTSYLSTQSRSGEVEPGIPEMLQWYRSSPEQFVQSALSRAIVRKSGSQVTLEPEDAGRILVFGVDQGFFAAPHPDLRIDDTTWHDTGIGSLFTCDEFADGNSYESFTMESPAVLEQTGASWRIKKQGHLRLLRTGTS